jgi:uncharacterized protein YrzB (UPF0473 family)
MENKVYVKRENGETIAIEIIFSFVVEELNKKYIAYTFNDDGKSESVEVFISEIDENNNIKSIPFNEKEMVMEVYEKAKELIEEE